MANSWVLGLSGAVSEQVMGNGVKELWAGQSGCSASMGPAAAPR